MKFKKMLVVISLLLITSLFTGCVTYDNFTSEFFSEKGAAAETIRIGVLEPLTGNDSKKAELEIRGIKLANKLYGEALGKKIELVYGDTQSSVYAAETAIKDLIAKKPAVVLGSYGEAITLIAGKHLNKAKMPGITISTTNPLITENNPYMFRIGFLDSSFGRVLAQYAVKELKSPKLSILSIADDDLSRPIKTAFAYEAKAVSNDKDIIGESVEIQLDQADYTKELAMIKLSDSKVLFMPINSSSVVDDVLASVSKLNMTDFTILGLSTWLDDGFYEVIDKYPNLNIQIPSDYTEDVAFTEISDIFLKAYYDEYGKSEPPAIETALAFDSYLLAIRTIEKVGSVNEKLVLNALAKTQGFNGASGVISFDRTGNAKKSINIGRLINDQFVSVYINH